MARRCEICGRSTAFGNQITRRGLAKAKGGVGRKITGKSRRTFKPNIQKVRVYANGGVKRMKVCTRCLKRGLIQKPPPRPKEVASAVE